MTKKTVGWIIGLGFIFLIMCAGSILFALLLAGSMGGETDYGTGEAVALIRVEGIIQPGEPPEGLFSDPTDGAYSTRIVRLLKQANNNSDVKVVVLRVDSPGGGVVASDEIYEQIVAMDKPVIISMGTLAASGGYYISAPADEIWANRHTLTGSIGVIIQFVNIEDFIQEYGIEATTIKSGVNKDTGDVFREMTPEEQEIWQEIIDESYDVFVQIIAEGRSLDEEIVRNLADGRVYTGKQALELGLVDNLGNLDDVITRAGELGGIEGTPRVIDFSRTDPVFGGILGQLHQPTPVEELQQMLQLNTSPTLMYLYGGR